MKRLSWRSILQRIEGRRIVGLWYGVEDSYLRIELDELASFWAGRTVSVQVTRPTS